MVFYEQNATEAEVLQYYYAEDRIVQPGFYLELPQVYQNTVRYYLSTKISFAHVKFFSHNVLFLENTSVFGSFIFNTRLILWFV